MECMLLSRHRALSGMQYSPSEADINIEKESKESKVHKVLKTPKACYHRAV